MKPRRTNSSAVAVVYPPSEGGQHTHMEVGARTSPDGSPAWGARNATQRPLDRYLRREVITAEQFCTAQRIYRTWYYAGRSPVVCGAYNQRITGNSPSSAEAREDARRDYQDALRAIGPVFSAAVVSVCLMGESAEGWALATNRRPECGIAYLRDALDLLLAFYETRHREKHNG